MSINPQQLLNYARSIDVIGGECHIRAAIGRAYYAAYHGAESSLPVEFRSQRQQHQGAHEYLIACYKMLARSTRPGRTNAGQLVQALEKMRRLRRVADYDLAADVPAKSVVEALTSAAIAMRESAVIHNTWNPS